jgi:Tfp pilus assembly protein PilF
MATRQALLSLITLLVLALASPAAAQEAAQHQRAEDTLRRGNPEEAERMFDRLLQSDPDDLRARLGRATARSWRGDRSGARADYRSVLNADPEHLQAILGLAWDFAWGGLFDQSERTFRQALELDPENPDALKGLAWVELWRGRPARALEGFEALRREQPGEPDLAVGAGHARLALGHHRRAAAAFRDALQLSPNRSDARQGLASLADVPSPFEANVWLGHSEGPDETGLRHLELASWIRPGVRVWGRYDRSLALDNPVLSRSTQDGDAFFGGILGVWSGRWITRLELGRRSLENGIEQDLVQSEAVWLGKTVTVKAGGLFGPRSDDHRDWSLYGGLGIPLRPWVRLEPLAYLSSVGPAESSEWRLVLNSEFRTSRAITLSLGLGAGRAEGVDGAPDTGITTGHALLSVPVATYQRVHLLVRREDTPGSDLTLVSLGLSLRMPRS